MNFGLDSYSAFDEPFTFEDSSSKVPAETGSLSLRSLSPENPVLGDSGWDEDGEKVDLFPSPTKRTTAPFELPSLDAPLSEVPDITDDIPTATSAAISTVSLPIAPTPAVVIPPPLPLPIHVPVIITPASVVIPSGTARFTGFTSTSQVQYAIICIKSQCTPPYCQLAELFLTIGMSIALCPNNTTIIVIISY